MLTPEQEYYARVCERDASWHVFCDCPTDSTWARYQDACKAVTAAEQGAQNRSREVIWFSPHCVPQNQQLSLL